MQSSNVFEVFLPEGTLKWFEVVKSTKTEKEVHIILEEKNIPPVTDKIKNKKISNYSSTLPRKSSRVNLL